MTDQYETAVKKMMEYLDQTVVFAKGELPDVAQQMLVYGATMAQFWMFFWVVISGISFLLWLIYCCIRDDEHMPGKILCGMVVVVIASIAGASYSDVVKIKEAPKLYIMQEMAAQAKKTQCKTD